MTRSSTRISLIERPVNQPIEKHRCSAREYHTENNQAHDSQRRPAICRHHQRAQSKRQREDRVRETNQPEKSRYKSSESRLFRSQTLRILQRDSIVIRHASHSKTISVPQNRSSSTD